LGIGPKTARNIPIPFLLVIALTMESQEPYFLADLGPTLPRDVVSFLDRILVSEEDWGVFIHLRKKKKKLIFKRESKENSTPLLGRKEKKKSPKRRRRRKTTKSFFLFCGHKIS
jgi:hypothetical protein